VAQLWIVRPHRTVLFMSRSYHITRRSAAARKAAGDDEAIPRLVEKQIVKQEARRHGHAVRNSFLVRAVRHVKRGDKDVA
jgi:hypothetical protein